MITRFYSFPTQQDFINACSHLTHLNEHNEPEIIRQTHDYSIDEVGIIYKKTGVMLQDITTGMEYPESLPISGWHVNAISNEPILPAQVEVFPKSASRVFA